MDLQDGSTMLESFGAIPNPHPYLERMKELATTANTASFERILEVFNPFLNLASHEEFHLLIQFAWDKLLNPVELRLWEASGRLYKMGEELGIEFTKVWKMHNSSFSEQPSSVSFIAFDATFSGVSRRELLHDLANILKAYGHRLGQEERVMATISACRLQMAKRDSVVNAKNEDK